MCIRDRRLGHGPHPVAQGGRVVEVLVVDAVCSQLCLVLVDGSVGFGAVVAALAEEVDVYKRQVLYVKLPVTPEALPLGATATTAASGGNREELLGPRPAGWKNS